MKYKLFLFLYFIGSLLLFSQEEDAWLFFKNKPNAEYFIKNPLEMLSQKAIDRRTKQNIVIDEKDAPIERSYYNKIKSIDGILVLAKSKWLNAVHIRGTKNIISSLSAKFNFIKKIEFANKSLKKSSTGRFLRKKTNDKLNRSLADFKYGSANNQITMLKGEYLHQKGFTGNGMIIAVLDAGFPNVNTLSGFERIRKKNKILGGYNFVERNKNFYTGHRHGTQVLSTISGHIKGNFIGTAPDASFYLFITENVHKEEPLEESLWVEATEKADSLGVDIINSSLGYSNFDNPSYSYTYSDMNGKTTFISRGAEVGASKGIIIVVSAGNEGSKDWKHITAPADSDGVLTVGAVKADKSLASFSSRGLTSDGRIKPDVMAQGQATAVINYSTGKVAFGSGTSFSSPVMAGVVACLWQALPNKTAEEIKNIVRQSSDRYKNPNADYGYGIPNFKKAHTTLKINKEQLQTPTIYPNPTSEYVFFKGFQNTIKKVDLFSILGEKIKRITVTQGKIDVSNLPKGVYVLRINKYKTIKLIKN